MANLLFIINDSDRIDGERDSSAVLINLLCLIGELRNIGNFFLCKLFKKSLRIAFRRTGLRQFNDIHIASATLYLRQTLCRVSHFQSYLYTVFLFERLNNILLYDILIQTESRNKQVSRSRFFTRIGLLLRSSFFRGITFRCSSTFLCFLRQICLAVTASCKQP